MPLTTHSHLIFSRYFRQVAHDVTYIKLMSSSAVDIKIQRRSSLDERGCDVLFALTRRTGSTGAGSGFRIQIEVPALS